MVKKEDDLGEMLQFLHNLSENYSMELSKCPDARLLGTKRGRSYNFYAIRDGDETYSRKGITQNKTLIKALCRKKLLQETLKRLENDIKLLENARTRWQPVDAQSVIESLDGAYSVLPAEFFYDSLMQSGDAWAAAAYNQSDYKPENKIHVTSKGLRVRSKSEALIAERLYANDIAFHYEEVLNVGSAALVPDFTIRRPDGSIVYWEHCGLTGDAHYMRRHYNKLEIYRQAGIAPWHNLIVTYDDEKGHIDMNVVESEICNKLKV